MINETIQAKVAKIKCFISDVDGVLTDGGIWYSDDDREIKHFHIHDGLGIKRLQKSNIIFAIISGRSSKAVTKRMQELNVKYIYQGTHDNKIIAFKDLLAKVNLSAKACAYIGDDLPDIPVMQEVGFSIAVDNAVAEVKESADWVTKKKGGNGAVREACELILKLQKNEE